MQEYFKINGITVAQPDANIGYKWEVKYTEDSDRVQSGKGYFTPLFTVEQFSYSATDLSAAEVSQILQMIKYGSPYTIHVFTPLQARWIDVEVVTSEGSMTTTSWEEDGERYANLSFAMTGVNPV